MPRVFSSSSSTIMPAISTLRMDLRVTRLAQRNQIAPIMCATFTQRQLVMNLLSRNQYPTGIALLTEGMLRSILVTNSLPCSAISALGILISAVLFVLAVA